MTLFFLTAWGLHVKKPNIHFTNPASRLKVDRSLFAKMWGWIVLKAEENSPNKRVFVPSRCLFKSLKR